MREEVKGEWVSELNHDLKGRKEGNKEDNERDSHGEIGKIV